MHLLRQKNNYIISTDFKESIEVILERTEIMFGRPTVRERLGLEMTEQFLILQENWGCKSMNKTAKVKRRVINIQLQKTNSVQWR